MEPRERGLEGPKAHRVKPYRAAGALQLFRPAPTIPAPLLTFEGLSNLDNFNLYGFRVNPPDPDGAVGPNHYVELINVVFAVYDKQGNRLTGPTKIGDLWTGFAIPDCTDPSGDPVVLYDKLVDRWLLSQFTTRGLNPDGSFNGLPFYNCVAISQTGDPTGAYFRYAFITANPGTNSAFFPDYPKYGNWKKSYVLTSRDFGSQDEYGISVYALEKNKMIAGNPNARAVHFFLDSAVVPLYLIGDGLLPADLDGTRQPSEDAPVPIVGTQDDNASYGAPFDALNIWELSIKWKANPEASIVLKTQLPVASFDSIYPCGVVPSVFPGQPTGRDCLPQPGITDGGQYLDILSYRQRPTFRLAYRNFGTYESLVTNQSVEALPNVAGARRYEIRRTGGSYSLYQQGTYAPNDGVHRWMGSVAMDKNGNMALGFSVVNGSNVFPGIRYTGRLAGDPLGQMTLGEGTIINGAGVQTTTNSRWGDYTDLTVDPTDDCTFWYVNEYYEVSGLPLPLPPPPLPPPGTTAPWQTRIGSFKLPGCQ
ncbi:MAG TPA: hypothetical protein VKD91_08355 [Pyrinomonadaceae bacterium]|nr:hypothetical protein [Pyrinomonadaceae bacterium]